MAKDVIVHIWCDVHMERDERVEGVELPPITVAGRTMTLDLCDPCTKEFVTPLAQILENHGVLPQKPLPERRGGRKTTAVRGAQCVWCVLDFSVNSSSGYMSHIKNRHGYANAIEAFGTVCAICGKSEVRMMMAHVTTAHPEYGFTHTSQVVHWAKDNGDPWGVYAATLSRTPSLKRR